VASVWKNGCASVDVAAKLQRLVPFTPLHMGPGMALKALAGSHLSLVSFGVAQVAMDIEPLVHMLRGDSAHHGFAHTYIGATVVGFVALPVARAASRRLSHLWNQEFRAGRLAWLAEPVSRSWMPIVVGTFAGTYSHVMLDSILHADMAPLAPFRQGNAMLHLMSFGGIHLFCLASGILGLCVWAAAQRIRAAGRAEL
jgi:membrane-bound metal-dependent hydrolase YbcI (DUF457 family)